MKEDKASDAIQKTLEFFLSKFNQSLSCEEAREINKRVTVAFCFLIMGDREQNSGLDKLN